MFAGLTQANLLRLSCFAPQNPSQSSGMVHVMTVGGYWASECGLCIRPPAGAKHTPARHPELADGSVQLCQDASKGPVDGQ
jgi:hypothetical protein